MDPRLNSYAQTIGRSRRYPGSRVYTQQKKHTAFRLNVCATICLDRDCPVIKLEFRKTTYTGIAYSNYLNNLQVPEWIRGDIIDRHTIHQAIKVCRDQNIPTVRNQYRNLGIEPVFIPAGYPELNPIEQFFNHIDMYVKDQAPTRRGKDGWSYEELKKVIQEAANNVTFDLVKAYYRHSFKALFPTKRVPQYLQ